MRRREKFAIGLLAAIAAGLIAGIVIQLFINSTNERQDTTLNEQVAQNRGVVCGIANQTALTYRAPLPGEADDHFADRMRAQRFTLGQASGSHCGSIEGLEGFQMRRAQAIFEIERTLAKLEPSERKPRRGPGAAVDRSARSAARRGQAPDTPASTSPGSSAAPPGTPGSPSVGGGQGGGSGELPGGGGSGGPGPPPPPTPSPQPDQSLLGPTLSDVCETVGNLGVQAC